MLAAPLRSIITRLPHEVAAAAHAARTASAALAMSVPSRNATSVITS
jgi:hypothetical protein